MKNITVIGSGTMGSGIAHCFAQYGFTVSLVDLTQDALDTAKIKIGTNLDRQVKKALLTQGDRTATLRRISFSTELQKATAVLI